MCICLGIVESIFMETDCPSTGSGLSAKAKSKYHFSWFLPCGIGSCIFTFLYVVIKSHDETLKQVQGDVCCEKYCWRFIEIITFYK